MLRLDVIVLDTSGHHRAPLIYSLCSFSNRKPTDSSNLNLQICKTPRPALTQLHQPFFSFVDTKTSQLALHVPLDTRRNPSNNEPIEHQVDIDTIGRYRLID